MQKSHWVGTAFNFEKLLFCKVLGIPVSVAGKKSPNVYKSCLKIISPEKWKIWTPFQKLPKNVVGDLGNIVWQNRSPISFVQLWMQQNLYFS